MPRPYLFIVTGRPGSGKSTFAREFSKAALLPVVSRDEIKEGFVHTQGKPHSELPTECNAQATGLFFGAVEYLVRGGVSLIAEAAFQHKVWRSRLEPLLDIARVHVFICSPGEDGRAALERFLKRGLDDSRREYFHGDIGVKLARQGMELPVSPYEELRLDVPTWHIDTSDGYRPGIDELIGDIWGGSPGPFNI